MYNIFFFFWRRRNFVFFRTGKNVRNVKNKNITNYDTYMKSLKTKNFITLYKEQLYKAILFSDKSNTNQNARV